jgi:putative transposase
MPRIARIVVPGAPHHLTQQGNNSQDIFFVKDDRRVYLDILKEQSDIYGLKLHGYSLMTNHVHQIGTPSQEDSLAKAIGRTHLLYAQYINRLHKRTGHLWHSRFYSCVLDERHFWAALRYVERNPVRAKIVRHAWEYQWSSAAAHVHLVDTTGLIDIEDWQKMGQSAKWQETLRHPDDKGELARLRLNTHIGRPLGSDGFLSKIEHALGRRLRPLPVGRPKRVNAHKQK